jgi:DNA repair protein RadC
MKIPQIEISIKYKGALKSELTKISSSKEIYDVLKQIYNADTVDWFEELILICLNQSNKVIGFYKVSQGGITGTVCDPKIILTIALNCPGTTTIILSHNHPSGNLQPSNADKQATEKIKTAASYLDIKLLDHVIYTPEGYYSFLDDGQL